jgi:hypothetical protein
VEHLWFHTLLDLEPPMFAALRTATARFLGVRPLPAGLDESVTDVTHLLEAVTAPLPVAVGSMPGPTLPVDEPVAFEWGDELGEEDLSTDEMPEREARQVLLQAGIQLDSGRLEAQIDRGLLAVAS